MTMTQTQAMPIQTPAQASGPASRLKIHAVLLGDRLVADRSSNPDMISSAPFCVRKGDGYLVVFRYGALVLAGPAPEQEQAVLAHYGQGVAPVEEERLEFSI